MVIKFKVESKEIQNMSITEFNPGISNKRNHVNHHLIEQLKPITCSQDALFACHVRVLIWKSCWQVILKQ